MRLRSLVFAVAILLAGCAAPQVATRPVASPVAAPIEVQILAFNDFHGNIVAPPPIEVTAPDGTRSMLASGGVARLARALTDERRGHPYSITVSAGDLIGASPLVSGAFLDEPTIAAMNLVGLDLNAAGNHEFDKGPRELWRMQAGGCAKFTTLTPCRIEPFAGAKFRFLAANVRTADGVTLFAPTAIRQFGPIRIGFIGMTLKGTGGLVSPASAAGLTFTDEAATANALVPELKAAGADTIILLIHQGGKLPAFTTGQGCDGIDGGILPILDKLDPAIATVVSGHTHYGYICRRGGRLLTSAGKYGYLYSTLALDFDPASHRLVAQRAENHVTGTAERGEEPAVKALVDRYVAAAAPVANRVIGHLAGPAPRDDKDRESPAANLNADAFLDAGRAAGAQLALVNATGVRVALVPGSGGAVTYGQVFSMVPFHNQVVVKTLTGAQLKSLLEQQFQSPSYAPGATPSLLVPSAGFTFDYDLSRPAGSRIVALRLGGKPVSPTARYRVATNNYLANGGDGFSVLTQGSNPVDAGLDIDALAGWLVKGQRVPAVGRTRNLTR
jgi:5'-nucleotidase